MISTAVLYNEADLFAIGARIEQLPDLYQRLIRDVFWSDIAPGLLAELRYYPQQVKHPFEFATDRSRRYWFAVLMKRYPNGYIRTGRLREGWTVNVDFFEGDVVMSAGNRTRYQKWVTGVRQVPGHRNSGWPLSTPIFQQYRDIAKEVTRRELHQFLKVA